MPLPRYISPIMTDLRLLVCALLTACLTLHCQPPVLDECEVIDPSLQERAIVQGSVVPDSDDVVLSEAQQNAVAGILFSDPADGNLKPLCSGVLIGQTSVLTSAQCVQQRSILSLFVAIGLELRQSRDYYSVSRIDYHPDFQTYVPSLNGLPDRETLTPDIDLAIVTIQESIPTDYLLNYNTRVEPIALRRDAPDAAWIGAQRVLLTAGFGKTEPTTQFRNYLRYWARVRPLAMDPLARTVEVRAIPENVAGVCTFLTADPGQPLTIAEDAGAPLFNQRPDGTVELIGISTLSDAECFDDLQYARIDLQVDWIRTVMGDDWIAGQLGNRGACIGNEAVFQNAGTGQLVRENCSAVGGQCALSGNGTFRCIVPAEFDYCG